MCIIHLSIRTSQQLYDDFSFPSPKQYIVTVLRARLGSSFETKLEKRRFSNKTIAIIVLALKNRLLQRALDSLAPAS